MNERNWSGRAFTSLCALVSFILLCVTGMILYVEPQGRVAYWIQWHFLSLEKDQWGSIHVYSGFLLLVSGGFHIYYNWAPLMKYLSSKIENALRHKKELMISAIIFIWVPVSGIWSLPPLVYVSDLGEAIKNSWVTAPEFEPPFGHAELVSLQTFCKKQRIPLDEAMLALRNEGFTIDSPKSTLTEIAESKQTSGMGVYEVIKRLEAKPEAVETGGTWTPETVEETLAGTGLGNKTIGQIIKEMELNPDKVYPRLKAIDIAANSEDRLKSLADKNNTTPIKLMTAILVKNSQVE